MTLLDVSRTLNTCFTVSDHPNIWTSLSYVPRHWYQVKQFNRRTRILIF